MPLPDIASPSLGSSEHAEALLRDLYVRLRHDLKKWATVTMQTPQPRMGYVGQHLVSVVTGFQGGRSGARGDDLKMPSGRPGEIKCCYRVDQLGKCGSCGVSVASIESRCPNEKCRGEDIRRSDDSKWLLSPKNEKELEDLFFPEKYYFVLFEFEDINKADNVDVIIYEVSPTAPGFALCMIDYYFNIRSKSKSKAPFNLWPHSAKFTMMKPKKIYHSTIHPDDTISTTTFPGVHEGTISPMSDLQNYVKSGTITEDVIDRFALSRGVTFSEGEKSSKNNERRHKKLLKLQSLRDQHKWNNEDLCDDLAKAVFGLKLAGFSKWTDAFAPDL